MKIEYNKNNRGIYIIEVYGSIGEKLYKIGYSNDIKARLDMQKEHYPLFNLIDVFRYKSHNRGFVDFLIDKYLKNKDLKWFDEEEVKIIMKDRDQMYVEYMSTSFKGEDLKFRYPITRRCI